MNIITRTVDTTGIHTGDYLTAATRYNRFARAQNRRLILGLASLTLGILLNVLAIGFIDGGIKVYNGTNTGICIQNVGGLEIAGPDGMGFFDGQDC